MGTGVEFLLDSRKCRSIKFLLAFFVLVNKLKYAVLCNDLRIQGIGGAKKLQEKMITQEKYFVVRKYFASHTFRLWGKIVRWYVRVGALRTHTYNLLANRQGVNRNNASRMKAMYILFERI